MAVSPVKDRPLLPGSYIDENHRHLIYRTRYHLKEWCHTINGDSWWAERYERRGNVHIYWTNSRDWTFYIHESWFEDEP